ncbi:hypothetical protein GCM10009821_26440 [Aeromicrobium halocynthiae]|uniref:Uncharacterized protein n=1 Tax=Aeromicrobium halocynthiae TaxID=560557 RepID=A0ABP5HRE7_9ACTN
MLADVRSDRGQGTLLHFTIGNAGPTIARTVRVSGEPPLPVEGSVAEHTEKAMARIAKGMDYLAPGVEHSWSLGRGSKLLEHDLPMRHEVTIMADGPYGPIDSPRSHINLADFC